VLAKQTLASGGRPLFSCNTLHSMYADVLPPEKLMTVGSSIL